MLGALHATFVQMQRALVPGWAVWVKVNGVGLPTVIEVGVTAVI